MKVLFVMIICLAIASCNRKAPEVGEKPKMSIVEDFNVYAYGVNPLLDKKERLLAVLNRPHSQLLTLFLSAGFAGYDEGYPVPITRYDTEVNIHSIYKNGATKDTVAMYKGFLSLHVGNHINIADGSTVYPSVPRRGKK